MVYLLLINKLISNTSSFNFSAIFFSHAAEAMVDPGVLERVSQERDIHIHFPEGALDKDGPSAGVALVCVLVSLLANRYR
jgi:ATP-dependent Lon protease